MKRSAVIVVARSDGYSQYIRGYGHRYGEYGQRQRAGTSHICPLGR